MAITFNPGESGTKTNSQTVTRTELRRYVANDPIGTSVSTGSILIERAYRSPRAKGTLINLPGGGRFLTSTAIERTYYSLSGGSAAIAGRKASSPPVFLSYVDTGREATFLNQADDRLLIRGTNIPTDARNEAVTKALNNIADQKANWGEAFATWRQTADLFASKASQLENALRYAKSNPSWQLFLAKCRRDLFGHGRQVDINRFSKKAANEYLQYVYGLKPLMQDIYNTHQYLKRHSGDTMLVCGRGRSSRTEFRGESGYLFSGNSRNRVVSKDAKFKVSCTLWARLDPDCQFLRSANQLGLLNPAELAWDLVSWSFVLDWFVPVGPVLSALTAPAGLIFVDGSISMRNSEVTTLEYQIWIDGTKPGQTGVTQFESSPFFLRYEGYKRSRLTSWPIPGFWANPNPLSGDRPYKAIALGIQNLERSRF